MSARSFSIRFEEHNNVRRRAPTTERLGHTVPIGNAKVIANEENFTRHEIRAVTEILSKTFSLSKNCQYQHDTYRNPPLVSPEMH